MPHLPPLAEILAAFGHRAAESIADFPAPAIGAIAALVAVALAALGYRHYIDDYTDATHILRIDGDRVERVTLAALTDTTRDVVAALTRAAGKAPGGRAERRVRGLSAAMEARPRPRGLDAYLRAVTIAARDRLPEATAEEIATMKAQRAAERTTKAPADRRDYFKQRREAIAARRDTEARELIGKWADGLPAGRHPLPDLWAAFSEALAASRKLPKDHGARLIGKNRFYAALEAHGRVVTGGQRKRFYVVPEEVTA